MQADAEPTIRRAKPEDYAQVCDLLGMVDRIHRDRAPWLFQVPDGPPRSAAFFHELLSNPDTAVFVAAADRLVGLAHGVIKPAPELPIFVQQRWGVLDGLVVDPAWQRRGLGRQLTQAFETWSLGLGAAWVELNVYAFNQEARKFYEALGYLPLSSKLRKPRTDAG